MNLKRVVIKISGEGLMGKRAFGIDNETIERIVADIKIALDRGIEIAVVVGGGNIFRGGAMSVMGVDRTSADHMGMLATTMNSLALREAFSRIGVESRVLSAIPMEVVCETYTKARAEYHLTKGRVPICAAGLGIPFFTTDSAAAERASELKCDAVLKATQVDGVYSKDPNKYPDAIRYETLSFDEALRQRLGVMDAAAFALCHENHIKIVIFSLNSPNSISNTLAGSGKYSIIC